MTERAYPITEEEQLKRRILTPQPKQIPYSPFIDLYEAPSAPSPEPARIPGLVFAKSCQLPDGIISYNNPTVYVPLELIKDYGHFTLLGGREVDSQGGVSLRKISGSPLPVGLGQLVLRTSALESAAAAVGAAAGGCLQGWWRWPGRRSLATVRSIAKNSFVTCKKPARGCACISSNAPMGRSRDMGFTPVKMPTGR